MRRVLKVLGLFGLVAVCAVFLLILKFNSNLKPTSDIRDYEDGLSSLPAELVEHFPKAVPAGAQARFYYRPGFLQGGTTVQLRLMKDAASIRDIRARYETRIADRWRGCPPRTLSADLMPWPQLADDKPNPRCDYDVYVLRTTGREDWNHGFQSGIAFSDNRGEVLYWAETW